jgi:hypothetical protein
VATCPTPGCCDGTTCQPGNTDTACGLSGTCANCTSTAQTCDAGVCVP